MECEWKEERKMKEMRKGSTRVLEGGGSDRMKEKEGRKWMREEGRKKEEGNEKRGKRRESRRKRESE